jgi:hypothetical protein
MQAFKTTKKKRLLIESKFDEWQSLLMLHKVSLGKFERYIWKLGA